jgi:hypothetical protein
MKNNGVASPVLLDLGDVRERLKAKRIVYQIPTHFVLHQ